MEHIEADEQGSFALSTSCYRHPGSGVFNNFGSQVDLVGPIRKESKWQARAGEGFTAADFKLDWSAQQATCPQGHKSQSPINIL